jgi:hypothetical protein
MSTGAVGQFGHRGRMLKTLDQGFDAGFEGGGAEGKHRQSNTQQEGTKAHAGSREDQGRRA